MLGCGLAQENFALVASAPVAAPIRAGADVVAGHHAHIARGIELIGGKPVFHGLGNGCVVTHALSPAQDHPARAEWAERRKLLFGFEPLPDYPLAPFHPDARNGMIGRLLWRDDGTIETGIVPLWFEPPGRPVPAGKRAQEVADYIDGIGRQAGLDGLAWRTGELPWGGAGWTIFSDLSVSR